MNTHGEIALTEYRSRVGQVLGLSEWLEVSQRMIDQFADDRINRDEPLMSSQAHVGRGDGADLDAIYDGAFRREPFVQVLGEGKFPEVRDVRGTNNLQLGWTVPAGTSTAIVFAEWITRWIVSGSW